MEKKNEKKLLSKFGNVFATSKFENSDFDFLLWRRAGVTEALSIFLLGVLNNSKRAQTDLTEDHPHQHSVHRHQCLRREQGLNPANQPLTGILTSRVTFTLTRRLSVGLDRRSGVLELDELVPHERPRREAPAVSLEGSKEVRHGFLVLTLEAVVVAFWIYLGLC